MKLPIVCLVGRTNVGKSALFNRISHQKIKSLVFDKENVTRDYIEATVKSKHAQFHLIDTGGIFAHNSSADPLGELVRARVFDKVNESDLVFFVCDAKVGLLEQDVSIFKMLRKLGKKIWVLVNKADSDQNVLESSSIYSLGAEKVFFVSAVHGKGMEELDEELGAIFPKKEEVEGQEAKDEDYFFKVCIIGKPNVGKSSLLNILSQNDRSIVSDIEGTTREAVSIDINFNHQLVELTDTPGIRRCASVNDDLEKMMVKKALEAVRVNDICILVIDGSKGALCNQELKLLNYGIECKKAVVLVINKTDLMTEATKTALLYDVDRYDFMLKKVPIVKTSCLDKRGIGKVRAQLAKVWKRCSAPTDDLDLTTTVRDALAKTPLFKMRQQLKVFKVRRLKAKVPTFQLFVNNTLLFTDSELTCIENILRKNFDFQGCPVILTTTNI